ncbi:sigma-54-dependent transcriptional regulator [Insolitispirillum peregrinum]|uniref:Two component, sigma54 specific, transcriptional regulator, Fis family n=1 Tax=Insolitispirillum peregrinum TaxID=80876 RepID=A0A1N7IHK2_9PROT|nr:sigma-54 dependent transcriptional regulator [Insolitispirillum peregrinum]SIS36548.1 two component, sigma54 specific, transcriptional regulator, Fis family [Insolitispirillum peregrinum]
MSDLLPALESLKVLIVEDDENVRIGCQQALQLEGILTEAVGSADLARKMIGPGFPGIVVTDIRLPGMDGMELLRHLHDLDSDLPVVLMTGHGDVAMAVQAMKLGAHDFIEKPFSPDYLVGVVRRALERRHLVLEVQSLRARLNTRDNLEARLIGTSASIEAVRSLISELGDTSADVLIHGETGTGKELVARCLHDVSPNRKGNFVAINCGGLPESLFESEIFGHEAGAFTGAAKKRIGKIEHANGGTLFLDEIESMPIPMQIKLLRVLQERVVERLGSNTAIPVNCRVIAATKADLRELSDQGQFRADLYYRLNVVTLPLPPLRERREDIALLFEHFAVQAAARHGRPVPPASRERNRQMMAYHWPGNVRELRNVADRCVLGIDSGFPPFAPSQQANASRPLAETVEAFERALITEALRRNDNSLARTSEDLQVAKTTLHDKIRKYGLND